MNERPSVLATRKFPDAVEARLGARFNAICNADDRPWSGAEIAAKAQGCVGIMCAATDPMGVDTIAALPASVKIISTFSVGYEHIDVSGCARRGILVSNTPGVIANATADVAMLLLLAAARRTHESATMLHTGQWIGWAPTMLLGRDLTGKRLGIIGMGDIGQALARRARGFDMEIHYHNRNRLAPAKELGATYHGDLPSLLAVAQFLSVNCPLTPQTRKLINRDTLALLPDGAIVVNTARGPIVDDEALIEAARSGKLAAIGLDVFEGEPKFNRRYGELANAFLLPHIGTATVETRNAMGFRALDNLEAVLIAGRTPPHQVTA